MANSLEEDGNHTEKIPMTEDNFDSRHSPSNADDMIPHKERPTLHEILRDFTQNTTFHGVRLIFMDHVGIVRRILWFLLFLTCTVLMTIQITNRVLHYYSYPINVNYDMNFDKNLPFPSVTVCNQNTFRATATSRRGWHKLVWDMQFSSSMLPQTTLEEYNATVLTLRDIYQETAHRKEDFIVACEWQNEACGPDNFTEVLTDQGVCYSFNDNGAEPLSASSVGPGNGLKLTLNVEEYEYMPKPYIAAGIKLMLHDQKQFLKVAERGMSVATGSHAFVGIQLQKVTNLLEPHGTCQNKPSHYYSQYSPDACQLTCMTQHLEKLCGCRHFYMPENTGYPPICTLDQYLNCLKDAMVSANINVRDKCSCPAPCDYLHYDPIVSYASTSKYATEKLLAPASVGPLHKKYMLARETAFRMDKTKFQHFTQLSNDVRTSFKDLQTAITRGVRNLQTQKTILTAINDKMKIDYSKTRHLFEWQKYHVEKNFVSAKDEMEEKIFSYLASSYPEFSFQVEFRIKQIAQAPWNLTISNDVKTAMYIEVLNMINSRINLAEKARESYKTLYNAYRNGEPIFTFSFQDEAVEDNAYITPRLLLNDSLANDALSSNNSVTFEEDLQYLQSAYVEYFTLARSSYYDGNSNAGELEALGVEFLKRCRSYYQTKRLFYSEFVDFPLKKIQEKITQFDQRWANFEKDYKLMTDRIDLILNNLNKVQKNSLSMLEGNIAKTQMYISANNMTMTELAEIFTLEQTQRGISEVVSHFSEFRARGHDVNEGWTALQQSTNGIWDMILEDGNLEEYYTNMNMTEFLATFGQVSLQVARNYTRFREMNPFLSVLSNLDTLFVRHLDRMVGEMRTFVGGSNVDKEFIKNNFLHIDVYYKEKGYQQITQQSTYDAFALFCDIGGTMALFLGASLLTLCELLDLGLHHAIYRLTHNDKIH